MHSCDHTTLMELNASRGVFTERKTLCHASYRVIYAVHRRVTAIGFTTSSLFVGFLEACPKLDLCWISISTTLSNAQYLETTTGAQQSHKACSCNDQRLYNPESKIGSNFKEPRTLCRPTSLALPQGPWLTYLLELSPRCRLQSCDSKRSA